MRHRHAESVILRWVMEQERIKKMERERAPEGALSIR
jgi:hypothetical protein